MHGRDERAAGTLYDRFSSRIYGLGIVMLGNDQAAQDLVQDNYRSLEDCQADWGRPEWCERVADSRSRSGFAYRGPSYSAGSRASAQSQAGGHPGSGGSPAGVRRSLGRCA